MAAEHTLRSPCGCGSTTGRIVEKGAQDCVYCLTCNAYQYNAPRTETGKPVRHIGCSSRIKPKQRARILMRATGQCELCRARPQDTATLHVGHILSVADGERLGVPEDILDSDENLCCLCDHCNLGMGRETIPLRLAAAMLMARSGSAPEPEEGLDDWSDEALLELFQ